ncbi:four-carbon acid sugar kinase family protein [Pectobacteriaceae bacterium CE70]|nr:four-carbon acid sugar kinase family protein [Pectobacteriaceae bacterium C52]WJV66215.1 four-carbon acid sugar kinase family protein [Pectobacteriaceae bacterium CE70]WJY10224.1 four-carbon acid sugar kinase family protein [Pectobacteriaceae bacterium C80]
MPKGQDVTQVEVTQVLVVADDFTGANDVGVGLSRYGTQTNVVFDVNKLHGDLLSDVTVINTDSRAHSASSASALTAQAVSAWLKAGGRGWIVKKIDSTLRGNPGAEIEAVLQVADIPLALVVPASPSLGRVTRNGQVWVNERLLTDTEFASDPKTPVCSASVGARLAEQSRLRQAEIHLSELRHIDLAAHLRTLTQCGVRLVIIDAENQNDLDNVIHAANQLCFKPLLVGSAGLSEALAKRIRFSSSVNQSVLAVVGSMSEIAQKQMIVASQQQNVVLIDIDVNLFFGDSLAENAERWVHDAVSALRHGQHCLLRTCYHDHQRFDIDRVCQQQHLSRQQLGENISQFLGELTRNIVRQHLPGGLYLSGGDIAIAVAMALGASGFQIKGQIDSCVPWGRFLDSVVGDIPVMTKAGGFGNETTLLHVLRFIEERVSE